MTDRLTQIETAARHVIDDGYATVDLNMWNNILALVEIAKAARGVMTQMDYETPHHVRLRAALKQLDEI